MSGHAGDVPGSVERKISRSAAGEMHAVNRPGNGCRSDTQIRSLVESAYPDSNARALAFDPIGGLDFKGARAFVDGADAVVSTGDRRCGNDDLACAGRHVLDVDPGVPVCASLAGDCACRGDLNRASAPVPGDHSGRASGSRSRNRDGKTGRAAVQRVKRVPASADPRRVDRNLRSRRRIERVDAVAGVSGERAASPDAKLSAADVLRVYRARARDASVALDGGVPAAHVEGDDPDGCGGHASGALDRDRQAASGNVEVAGVDSVSER